MKLSEHFTFEELTRTDIRRLQDANREMGKVYIPELRMLCVNLLEPLRVKFCTPIIVHSGYRCAELNREIGGSPTSQHIQGKAVDFTCHGWDDAELKKAFHLIASSRINFHQLLLEHGCIHISHPEEGDMLGEVGYWEGGKKTVIREAVRV
jgi:zinc D-Ala-D-Ala carboxypeptidase